MQLMKSKTNQVVFIPKLHQTATVAPKTTKWPIHTPSHEITLSAQPTKLSIRRMGGA